MPSVLNRYATPLLTGIFLVSLVSGIALFFHWNPAWFHAMHEWLSLLLILPFALHLWKNWRPLCCYLRRPAFAIAMLASLAAALLFVLPLGGLTGSAGTAGQGGRPAQFAVAGLMIEGTVDSVAAVLGETPDQLTRALEAAGIVAGDPHQSLSDLAAASGIDERTLYAVLAAQAR
ncbi:DUF4405 domain-containing protein [Salipiger thiooxidans]|jgi:hypothetical protein|uniref:DUF4405 domain-containing protein n=1 Tax=Salipiger thiooxidans TaxID=282683 RepID=UPI001CD512A7|nr:DUF4405 domain-containing protein [Salipiger thiooxidans]MCA0849070.1 DUF4405 domain-containing protein [Salipiger thiooxidans]